MRKSMLIAVVLLAALPKSLLAVRVLEQIEASYELALSNVDLPNSTAGAVVFNECPTCGRQSISVTANTRYFLDKQQVTLAELNQQASKFRQSPDVAKYTLVMVHYDIDTTIVTRVRINTPSIQ